MIIGNNFLVTSPKIADECNKNNLSNKTIVVKTVIMTFVVFLMISDVKEI